MRKTEKIEKVKNIKKYLKEAGSVFVTDFSGLNVPDITILRKNLRENSIRLLVAKNSLIKLAAEEADFKGIQEYLQGPTAIVFGADDPAIAAKILYDSYKDKEKPVIKAFVLDNQVFQGSEVKRLAELPSREILLSQLVVAIEAPISSLVSSIDGAFQELVGTLEALTKSKS